MLKLIEADQVVDLPRWGVLCKRPFTDEGNYLVEYIVPENPNMMHAKAGAIRTWKTSALGQETIGIKDSVGHKRMVLNYDMQNAFASALLEQLQDLCTDVKEHCRRLRPRQYSAIPQIEN